jgi:hypothetical protein
VCKNHENNLLVQKRLRINCQNATKDIAIANNLQAKTNDTIK